MFGVGGMNNRPVRTIILPRCPLTSREVQVLTLAGQGLCNKEIAQTTRISIYKVIHAFEDATRKLKAQNRTHAVAIALSNNWITLNTSGGLNGINNRN